jgi:hypothetical protein
MGLLEPMGSSLAVYDGYLFKPNGLRRCRADLFANDAVDAVGKRQASTPVDHGQADIDGGFFSRFQVADSLGWADLSTKGTPVLAITNPRHQYR